MFINFDKILNARDLGGIRTSGGGVVKSGLLLRTARLHDATDSDIDYLRGLGVKYVFDFRDPLEVDKTPDRKVPGAKNVRMPVLPDMPIARGGAKGMTEKERLEMFCDMYRSMALSDESAAAYGEFFHALLEGGGAIMWHCTQGKDRTGVAAILLLSALGAGLDDIRRDYFLSNEGMDEEYKRVTSGGMSETERRLLRIVFYVWPRCYDLYMQTLDSEYGGATGYLRERLGLGEAELKELRWMYTM